MTILLAVALGLGLATAAGLRVFLPLFGAGLAAHLGYIELTPGFAWLGGTMALLAFGTATVAEVLLCLLLLVLMGVLIYKGAGRFRRGPRAVPEDLTPPIA